MKFADLQKDTHVRPFRFAVVFAAIVVVMLISQQAKSQTAQHVNWTTSYEEALDRAQQTNTPVMLYFTGSDWCPWCQKLKAEVLETAEFAAWLDSRVIPIHVDFPRKTSLPAQLTQQNNELLNKYRPHLTGFPTVLFIKPSGTVIGKMRYEQGGVRNWIHKAQAIIGQLDKKT